MRMELCTALTPLSIVMPRLGLGIHEFGAAEKKLVDPKAKSWDDYRVDSMLRALQAAP